MRIAVPEARHAGSAAGQRRPRDQGLEPRLPARHDLGMAATFSHTEPVRVALDITALKDLSQRLHAARIMPGADGTWARGTPAGWLAELIADWQAFDPLTLQARLDKLTHLRVAVDGVAVHITHAPGTGPDPVPLLLTHGWPSSFLEYSKLLPLAHQCGARGLQDRALAELLAAGARPRRPPASGRDTLTPSELRIADLAAGGQTNREIAQRLFITPKTVEAHLARAFRKLHIDSRAQLPAALSR